jgi:hypothetical protein
MIWSQISIIYDVVVRVPDDSKLIELMFRVYPLEWLNKSVDQLQLLHLNGHTLYYCKKLGIFC